MRPRDSIHRIPVLILMLAFSSAVQARDADPGSKADLLVSGFFERSGAAGLVASVGLDGAIAWSAGYGYADVEQAVPMDPQRSRLRIGSVIKPMTAYAAVLLMGQGALDLDVPIQQYVDFPTSETPITMRHLLTHQSGIRHYAGDEFFMRSHYATVAEGLAVFADDPLVHPPGSAYLYSSYGFNLAGAVIEGASGHDYLDYMREQVFKPLAMHSVVPDHLGVIVTNRGRYYRMTDDGLRNEPEVDNSYKWPSGGFVGTSDDLVRFGLAMLEGEGIGIELRDLMWQTQPLANGEATDRALGWRVVTTEAGETWVGHTGGSVGGTTTFWILPAKGLVLALISNQSQFDFGDLPIALAALFGEQDKEFSDHE